MRMHTVIALSVQKGGFYVFVRVHLPVIFDVEGVWEWGGKSAEMKVRQARQGRG
jgi:hypothetical protein